MLFRMMSLALASVALAGPAFAQTTDPAQDVTKKLHDDLTARGFTDVKVVPQAFLISAKDKDGNPLVMLVGPNSMTVLSGSPPSDPNTAQSKEGNDKLIQQ
jgi:Peptidase propeptide and YPEB domain